MPNPLSTDIHRTGAVTVGNNGNGHSSHHTLGGGLNLTLASGERATISYTVVGQESGFFNYLVVEGVNIPETDIGLTTLASMTASGLLDFGFASNRQSGTDAGPTLAIINGGVSESTGFKLGFGTIEQTAGGFSVTAYFGDGTGDSDFDDIVAQIDVAISVVPIPAGALLLGTGLIGFGALRRHRRKNTLYNRPMGAQRTPHHWWRGLFALAGSKTRIFGKKNERGRAMCAGAGRVAIPRSPQLL